MPRFFFHVRHGDDFEPDLTGLDLPDADVAQSAGLRALHDLHAELVVEGFTDWTRELTDEAGEIILHLSVGALFPAHASGLVSAR